jgi:hypothetical protein
MSSSLRGTQFERRVLRCLEALGVAGFASQIRHQEQVNDRDGNRRKVDISFILPTSVMDLHITVECKSKRRILSLDDVDQLRLLKLSLPRRNLFWLISEGAVNSSVRLALEGAGIGYYSIKKFEEIVSDIVIQSKEYLIDAGDLENVAGSKSLDLQALRLHFHRFSAMHPGLCEIFWNLLWDAERSLLKNLPGVLNSTADNL